MQGSSKPGKFLLFSALILVILGTSGCLLTDFMPQDMCCFSPMLIAPAAILGLLSFRQP